MVCLSVSIEYKGVRRSGSSVASGWAVGLTFCGCGDGLCVWHGKRDGSYSAVMRRRRQDWGEVARDLSYHLTTAVRLRRGGRTMKKLTLMLIS